MRRPTIAAAAAAILSTCLPAIGQPVTAGEHISANIATPQNYPGLASSNAGADWSYTLSHPGATYISIHFVDFDLAEGDYLIVSDPDGAQSYTLEGKGKMDAGTFWAQHINGDTVLLDLVTRSTTGGRGFTIDEYVAGFVDLTEPGLRAICGADDKENAVCYQSSYPTEYDRGRAVARLLINGSALCTGWLASPDNMLITNEHCISSASSALNTDYEFMAEAPTCQSSNCQLCWPGTVFSGATYIQDSPSLDYCLVQINSGNPAGTYGYLDIDDRTAVVGEQIYIIGYPGGRAKEFTIESSAPQDPGGIATVYSLTQPPCAGSGYNDVGYYADTEGGSSGSPVLARSNHKVIALHHCALCPNRGVPINLVYAEISGFLGPFPPVAEDVDATVPVDVAAMIDLSSTDDGEPDPPAAMDYVIMELPDNGSLVDPGVGAIGLVPYTLSNYGKQVEYHPNPGFRGADGFSYKANDGGTPPHGGDSNMAFVSIIVGGPDWDPIAFDQQAETAVSVVTQIDLPATDPNGDPLTYTIHSLPAQGFLSDPGNPQIGYLDANDLPYNLAGGGSTVLYQPPCGVTTAEAFTFTASDATAISNVATVDIDVTTRAPRLVYEFNMDADAGWATEGPWAYGQPTGGGSHNEDPTAGHTGPNVYGYNLSGDYAKDQPVYSLTTTAFDCSQLSNTQLRFWRWLGVEKYDTASIDVSDDGTTWIQVWANPSDQSIADVSWTQQAYDISAVADGQSSVYVRWNMGPTDGSVTYPGWNIDDVEIWAVVPLVESDFNGDGMVTIADLPLIADCLAGPDVPSEPGCLCVDLDWDGDVDLIDFAEYQRAFGTVAGS